MNEIEIVFFTIYLDKVGWLIDGYSLEDNLHILALFAKVSIVYIDLFERRISIYI